MSARKGLDTVLPPAAPNKESHREPPSPLRLLPSWRRDPWVLAALVASLGFTAAYQLPISPALHVWINEALAPFFFLSLALASMLAGISRLTQTSERRFWRDFAIAYGFWWLNAGLRLTLGPVEGVGSELQRDVLYSAFYLVLVLAIERRPHRVLGGPVEGLSRALSWPSVAAFVVGLLLYFVFVPAIRNPPAYASGLPSFYFFLFLDLYLVINLTYLAVTTQGPRWARIYGSLAAVQALICLSDLVELYLYLGSSPWARELDFLWLLPLAALTLAVRLRHFLPPDMRAPVVTTLNADGLSGPSGRTLVTALAFPSVHFALYACGILDQGSRPLREQLVFGWLVLLGGISFFQSRLLDRRTRSLLADQAHFEKTLAGSENDLRLMVERSHSQDLLQKSERKFASAFRASPDVMVVSSMEEGRMIDVNHAFEQVTGYRREEVIGHTSGDLRFWVYPEERQKMIDILAEAGHLPNRPAVFRLKNGKVGLGLLSAEILAHEDSRVLLSVFHQLTFQVSKPEGPPDRVLGLLDHAGDAVFVIDGEQRMRYWNRGAESLLGWTPDEILGQPAGKIWPLMSRPAPGGSGRGRDGAQRFLTPDSECKELETWCTTPGPDGSIVVLALAPDR